jgi:hypothetical protein
LPWRPPRYVGTGPTRAHSPRAVSL